jgi:uncharacterized membrane protein YdjX (TVP38/TMEM64 family)
MSARSRVVWYGFAAALFVVGAVIAAAVGSTAGQVIGFVLIGFGLVLATSLVFYEVGLSEDRELARERAAQAAEARLEEVARERPDREPPSHERPGRVRLPRSRGRRRRIT